MILYTIVPDEFIFGNTGKDFKGGDSMEIDYLGEKVLVSKAYGDQYIIDRLISTSPKAYLNPKLQPGAVINR